MLALFRVISLDHAHPAQRLGEAARDFGVDLAAFTEDGTYGSKSPGQGNSNQEQAGEGQPRHEVADFEEHNQRDGRRQEAASELDQPSPQQIANAFYIAHDARNQIARLVGVIECDREPSDMFLYSSTQIGDQSL